MNFDELKERLLSELKQLWERIQDSSIYNQLRDRYENLTPSMQRLVVAAAAGLISLFILSIPYGYWSESVDAVHGFEDRRDLVRKLLKTSRDAADIPDIPQSPSTDTLTSEVNTILTASQLLPEQNKGVSPVTAESSLIPTAAAQGAISVSLAKLNLKQIIEIGYKIKAISPTVKMTAMQMFPNREKPEYFDVTFKLVSLAVPQAAPPAPIEEEEKPVKKSTSKSKSKSKGDEE
jgi:hypothetical protein